MRIEGSFLLFHQSCKGKHFFPNPISNNIFVFDQNTRETTNFNHFGNDYGQYVMIFNNLFWIDENRIGLAEPGRINVYSPQGSFLERHTISRGANQLAPFMNIFALSEKVFIAVNPPQGSFSDPEFYRREHPLIAIISLDNTNHELFGAFPPPGSALSNPDHYFLYPGLYRSTLDAGAQEYILVNKNDPLVLIYDYSKRELKETIAISKHLQAYKPVTYKFAGYKPIISDDADIYLNSSFQDIFVDEGKIYLTYTEGYSVEEMKSFIKSNPGFPNSGLPEFRYRLVVVNRENGMVKDKKLPSHLGKLIGVVGSSLLFQRKQTEEEEKKNVTTLLIALTD
jgi:hypothetical protein